MSLTLHQENILEDSLSILRQSNRLLIRGSAGVGKTYMVNELIKRLTFKIEGKILCAAPTNKAVAVLKGKVEKIPRLSFTTVHSALKLKRIIHYTTGDVSFKPMFDERYPPLKGVGLLVIDETSMLPKKVLKFLEEYADVYNVTIIFIGDEKQLPPVNEDVSPVFVAGYPSVELTEIVRQGEGNPIITLSRDLNLIKSKIDQRTEIGGYIYTQDKGRIINTLADVNGTDELKYLAWTNKDVDNINFIVRQIIYKTPALVEVGEVLIFDEPYGEEYFTNEEVKVTSTVIKEVVLPYYAVNNKATKEVDIQKIKIKYYAVNQEDFNYSPKLHGIVILHEDSLATIKKLYGYMIGQCKKGELQWIDYFQFKEQFASVKYNHAITVHKSQGSTYQKTILNVKNLLLNRRPTEREKLLYTGITRSSELLILYNI